MRRTCNPEKPVRLWHGAPSEKSSAWFEPAFDQPTDKTAIRPFHVNVPETELTELRRRINATKFPERETVTDATQGVQLANDAGAGALLGDRI